MSESVKVICDKQDLVSIADAIREKAGTTDGINFADMAALIEGIEAGGGSFNGGTITPAAATLSITIPHSLGVKPKVVIVFAHYMTDANSVLAMAYNDITQVDYIGGDHSRYIYLGGSEVGMSGNSKANASDEASNVNENTIDLKVASNVSSSLYFRPKKYYWIAFG